MEFRILGPLEVHGELGAVALGRLKPRAVLAALLLHANEPMSAERLAVALWGEDAPAGATKTVQVHLSRLRNTLGDPEVVATTAAGPGRARCRALRGRRGGGAARARDGPGSCARGTLRGRRRRGSTWRAWTARSRTCVPRSNGQPGATTRAGSSS